MNLGDRKAWDDSDLINTWDEALEEYKKYHSIHLSGKRLEDALTKEEMAQVIVQRKALRKGTHERPLKKYGEDGLLDDVIDEEHEMSISPERDIEIGTEETLPKDKTPTDLPAPTTNDTATSNALPQMPLLLGVQDENLKNLLMSWYYAGYHTGLYEGRQQALKEASESAAKT